MNYGSINNCDVANGDGVRVSLFVSGCSHHCKGCFNPETWDYSFGECFTREVEDKIMEMLKPDYISGLTLLGGDPMELPNQKALLPFLKRVKETYPDKTIWCYTGYVYEDICKKYQHEWNEVIDFLPLLDVLVDGPFIEERKNVSLKFRGSSNQRIINIKKTVESGYIHLL